MNAFASRFSIGQLATGISRTSIRYGHIKPRWKAPRPDLSGYAPGHGEKIYIFTNIKSQEIVYSHTKVLNVYKAFKQMPFAGKKNTPAKIRKDMWRPLAVVSFPVGQGLVGQSAFQRLREFRTRHLLEWGDEMFHKENPDKPHLKISRSRQERGREIIAQKANSVADLAAVLAGAGSGSRMWVTSENGKTQLCPATVEWANEGDHQYAAEWTPNVTHGKMETELKDAGVEVIEPEITEAVAESPEGPASVSPEVEAPQKKGLFSWS